MVFFLVLMWVTYFLILCNYRVIHKSLRDFRLLRYSSREGHTKGQHVNRGRGTPSFCPILQVLDKSKLGDAAMSILESSSCHTRCNIRRSIAASASTIFSCGCAPYATWFTVCGRNLITRFASASSPTVAISSTYKEGQKLGVFLPLLTCSPSGSPSRLLYRRGRKSWRDLWITLYFKYTLYNKYNYRNSHITITVLLNIMQRWETDAKIT
jgi:hypothetical protein